MNARSSFAQSSHRAPVHAFPNVRGVTQRSVIVDGDCRAPRHLVLGVLGRPSVRFGPAAHKTRHVADSVAALGDARISGAQLSVEGLAKRIDTAAPAPQAGLDIPGLAAAADNSHAPVYEPILLAATANAPTNSGSVPARSWQ